MRRMPSALVALVAASLATAGIAGGPLPPAGEPEGAHGAAPMAQQLATLEQLTDTSRAGVPDAVDRVIWQASIPADNQRSTARVELGRKLYFETALSQDGSVACATCHDVTRSFTDLRGVSEGVGDQLGRRNAPTTMNAALLQTQFWDGRSPSLEHQAGQPILNPVEMAMPSREAAVAALEAQPEYAGMFEEAYGRAINYADIERAIAAFERELIFLDAPFDRFLAGDDEAISEQARQGWALFNGKARCVSCHPFSRSNPLGTDNRFHNIGVSARHQDFEGLARRALKLLDADPSERQLDQLAVGTDLSELGRFMVTRNYADLGAFRTPQLRNGGITGPYMHDGSMQTLWDVMDHYNKGGAPSPFLDGGMEALALSEEEIDQLVAFLFTLTDDRFAEQNAKELAAQKAHAADQRPFRDEKVASRKVLDFEQRLRDER